MINFVNEIEAELWRQAYLAAAKKEPSEPYVGIKQYPNPIAEADKAVLAYRIRRQYYAG